MSKVDRRQGKRSLPPHEEKKEAFNFPIIHLTPSQNRKEQASPSSPPFSLLMSTNQNTTFFPLPHGQITTSEFVNSQNNPSQATNQGKLYIIARLIIYHIILIIHITIDVIIWSSQLYIYIISYHINNQDPHLMDLILFILEIQI